MGDLGGEVLTRVDDALAAAGFEEALKAALAEQEVLGTDETPAPLTNAARTAAANTSASTEQDCHNPHAYTVRTMNAYTGGGPDLVWYDIDVLVSQKRDLAATRGFFIRALEHGQCPTEVTTRPGIGLPRVIEELIPAARHVTEQYRNNPVEADHGRLKSRLRPMRGLKRLRSARMISAGHAFVQNLRRGHAATTK